MRPVSASSYLSTENKPNERIQCCGYGTKYTSNIQRRTGSYYAVRCEKPSCSSVRQHWDNNQFCTHSILDIGIRWLQRKLNQIQYRLMCVIVRAIRRHWPHSALLLHSVDMYRTETARAQCMRKNCALATINRVVHCRSQKSITI